MISNEHDSNGEPKGEVTSSSFPLRHPYKGIEGIREYAVTRDQLKGMSEIMKESKITVRPTPEEYEAIRKRAEAANMSVNRYLIESALRPMPGNDRKLSLLMGQLCRLENDVQETGDLDALQKKVKDWRRATIAIMGGC